MTYVTMVGPGGWFRARLPRALSLLRGAVALRAPATTFLLSRNVSNHAVLIQAYPSKTKKPT